MRAPYLAPVAPNDDGLSVGEPFSIRDFVRAVRRRWWVVPIVFVLFLLLIVYVTMG